MVRMLESSQLSVERLKSKLEKQQLQRLSEREEELRSATFTVCHFSNFCFSLLQLNPATLTLTFATRLPTCQVCVCAGGCPAAGRQGCGDRGGAGEGEEEEQDGDGDTQVDN